MTLFLQGCGNGSSSGAPATGAEAEIQTKAHPKVSAVEPTDQASDISAFSKIIITFDKAMNPASFLKGLGISPSDRIDSFECETTDCKKISINLFRSLSFGKSYILTLKAGNQGIRDVDGLGLEADYV